MTGPHTLELPRAKRDLKAQLTTQLNKQFNLSWRCRDVASIISFRAEVFSCGKNSRWAHASGIVDRHDFNPSPTLEALDDFSASGKEWTLAVWALEWVVWQLAVVFVVHSFGPSSTTQNPTILCLPSLSLSSVNLIASRLLPNTARMPLRIPIIPTW